MDKWQGKTLGAYPKTVCAECFDDARIHKNLSPFGLRIFLAQRRMFLSRRIALDTPPSEILFELSKIFRNAPHANF
jgi:hypothetical protein